MRIIFLIFFINLQAIVSSQNPNSWDTAWVSSYGGTSIDIGRDLKETSDKGFIITGVTSSFGNGNTSFYIIKTDSLGKHQWSKAIGTSNNDEAYSVDIASDGGFFFSGITNGNLQNGYDGYLIKTDNLGNTLWTKNYGGSDWDFIYNSCLMPDGGLILCGETYSDTKGGSDAYLIRTDANGDTLWTKKIGTVGDDTFYSVEQKNNRIYVVGKTFNTLNNMSDASIYKLDFSGTILQQGFTGNNTENSIFYDLCITSNSEIALCGKHGTAPNENYLFNKIDTTNFGQTYAITNNQNFYFNAILEGYNNDIYTLTPSTGGLGGLSASFFRFNSGFNYLAHANFGGIEDDIANEMIKTSKGYAMIGWTKSYGNENSSQDENVYLVVFNKKGLVNDYFIQLNEFQDTLPALGIRENKLSLSKTNVYPNPINALYTISFTDNRFDGKSINYQLFDDQGKLIDEELILVTDKHILINRKDFKAGIYSYRLKFNSLFIGSGKITAE